MLATGGLLRRGFFLDYPVDPMPVPSHGQVSLKVRGEPRLDAGDKCSELVHWEDPEGWGGEGGGRGDRDGEYM